MSRLWIFICLVLPFSVSVRCVDYRKDITVFFDRAHTVVLTEVTSAGEAVADGYIAGYRSIGLYKGYDHRVGSAVCSNESHSLLLIPGKHYVFSIPERANSYVSMCAGSRETWLANRFY